MKYKKEKKYELQARAILLCSLPNQQRARDLELLDLDRHLEVAEVLPVDLVVVLAVLRLLLLLAGIPLCRRLGVLFGVRLILL